MTHLMFEINLLLGCEAACWFTCCFEGRKFEVLGLQMLFFSLLKKRILTCWNSRADNMCAELSVFEKVQMMNS